MPFGWGRSQVGGEELRIRGRIRWFKESAGIGGVDKAEEFVATAAFDVPLDTYRPLVAGEFGNTRLARIRRLDQLDAVEVTFMATPEPISATARSFLLIQGPYPIAVVDIA